MCIFPTKILFNQATAAVGCLFNHACSALKRRAPEAKLNKLSERRETMANSGLGGTLAANE
jgi:hypothetical protein